jgi:hypothetical protein
MSGRYATPAPPHREGSIMTTPDERHADVVSRYPGGLTPEQFRHEALASADDDGKLDPPALADWFKAQSLLLGMWMEGLIGRRCKRNESGPYYITDKGRAARRAAASSPPTPDTPEG